MLRSISRAPRSSLLRQGAPIRATRPFPPLSICLAKSQQQRSATSSHAISNPTLASIEKRWENMSPQEQANLWMSLRDRMREDWHHLTMQEKKAAYWIAFGPHGPRKEPPPGENRTVAMYTAIGVGISFAIFAVIRYFAGEPPRTMNKEWQEATNEYLKAQNSEPITGLSSESYSGKGHVQSKAKKPE